MQQGSWAGRRVRSYSEDLVWPADEFELHPEKHGTAEVCLFFNCVKIYVKFTILAILKYTVLSHLSSFTLFSSHHHHPSSEFFHLKLKLLQDFKQSCRCSSLSESCRKVSGIHEKSLWDSWDRKGLWALKTVVKESWVEGGLQKTLLSPHLPWTLTCCTVLIYLAFKSS